MDREDFHISPLYLWIGRVSILVLYFMDWEDFHDGPLDLWIGNDFHDGPLDLWIGRVSMIVL